MELEFDSDPSVDVLDAICAGNGNSSGNDYIEARSVNMATNNATWEIAA